MIALLTDGSLTVRPDTLVEVLNAVIPDHQWSHSQARPDSEQGPATHLFVAKGPQGVLLAISNLGGPLPAHLVAEARARSWWYEEGERAAGHRHHWVIASPKPTPTWGQAVLRAKASSLIAALLVGDNPSIAAVWNGVNGTLFTPASVRQDAGFVAQGQVPTMFWVFNALHSLRDGDVSMTTGGMAPFVGYEIEIWNAPRTKEVVVGQLNNVLTYLLVRGPVLKAGETISREGDPEILHCDFGPSRTERNSPTQALFLTFGAEPRPAKAKPSLLGGLFGRRS
jgi:hypothetical protein